MALAAGEWALQAAALGRPTAAELAVVRTLRALTLEHRSQATLDLGGHRYRAVCNQAWYPHRRVAQVVATPLGVATQIDGRLTSSGPLDESAFDLAGCPRPLLRWLSSELVRGAAVHLRDVKGLDEIGLRPHVIPVEVFVAPSTGLPVRLQLTASKLDGTSRVRYGQ
jgi:hypothetical protein